MLAFLHETNMSRATANKQGNKQVVVLQNKFQIRGEVAKFYISIYVCGIREFCRAGTSIMSQAMLKHLQGLCSPTPSVGLKGISHGSCIVKHFPRNFNNYTGN